MLELLDLELARTCLKEAFLPATSSYFVRQASGLGLSKVSLPL